jgi:tetratricopeptide (TPR) repeat protein
MLSLFEEGSRPYGATLSERGRVRERGGDFDGALADYTAALEIAPDLPGPLVGQGRLLIRAGDIERAEQSLRRAIELHDSGIARDLLGGLALLRGDYQEAFDFYQAMLDNPHPDDDAIAYYGTGVARIRMGDEAGRADIQRAEQVYPGVNEGFEERGIRP